MNSAFPFLQEDIPLPQGNAYFIVAPHNQDYEGSHGLDNVAGEIAERELDGITLCKPEQALGCQ